MHEFQCGHQECGSGFSASDMNHLRDMIAEHLKADHAVGTATETLMTYLEATCVTSSASE